MRPPVTSPIMKWIDFESQLASMALPCRNGTFAGQGGRNYWTSQKGKCYHKSCSLKICEVQVSFTWIAKAKIYHVIDTQMEGRGRGS